MKNIPTLKAHLQKEWENEGVKEKAKLEKKKLRATKSDQPSGAQPRDVAD
jgi:aprataxin